jgi:hypothetical protein
LIHSASLLSPAAKVNLQFENRAREFIWSVIRGGFGLYIPPDLSPCDFYLPRRLKDKVYKTNPHNLEELTNSICHENSKIYGREPQRINNVLLWCTDSIRSGRQYFQHLL